jgi:glyoxylase-like metal-dependent hydrolase (beta-lactamase superfamily II)
MVAGVIAATLGCSAGHAAAPQIKTQAPGFYRMMLGDFEITALNDGVVSYSTAQILPEVAPDQIAKSLQAMGLSDPVGMSYNAFLINTGSKLILIDVGTGGKLSDSPFFRGAGRLIANLRAAGYRPEHVDEIYITHRGQDHIGGLTTGKERTFPNALVRAPKGEFDIFLDPEKAATMLAQASNDKKRKEWIQFTQALFKPYIQAGKFQSFDQDAVLTPGIRALATYGHTPGHTSYVVESKGQTLIILGDLILMGAMQFAQPSLTSMFDADRRAAAAQRQRVLRSAADNDYWLAGAHLSFPGIGHVRPAQQGYLWIPVNYTISQ